MADEVQRTTSHERLGWSYHKEREGERSADADEVHLRIAFGIGGTIIGLPGPAFRSAFSAS